VSFRIGLEMRLRGAYLSMHRTFQAEFAPCGVTADQFVVLSLLAEEDGIIQRELIRRTCSDANTITALLRLLERKGLIRRVRHNSDGRARCVHLTPEGRRLQIELARSSEHLHRRLQEAVPPDELVTLLRCLERVAAAMRPQPQRGEKTITLSTRRNS
jgi:DNA-binding MarR family transcriptional regulator